MPFRFRVLSAGEILLARAVGEADPLDWFSLGRSAPMDRLQPRCGLLVDLRRRQTLPSTAVARSIGEGLRRSAARFIAVALVARPGSQFGLARMVELIGGLHELPTATFSDTHEAWEWLRSQLDPGSLPVDAAGEPS